MRLDISVVKECEDLDECGGTRCCDGLARLGLFASRDVMVTDLNCYMVNGCDKM